MQSLSRTSLLISTCGRVCTARAKSPEVATVKTEQSLKLNGLPVPEERYEPQQFERPDACGVRILRYKSE